jgi:hypothetical protein
MGKRMDNLMRLAHYSKRIQLTIDAELVEKEIGEDFGEITEEIQRSIDCLLKDGRNTTMVTFDGSNTLIDIMVKE